MGTVLTEPACLLEGQAGCLGKDLEHVLMPKSFPALHNTSGRILQHKYCFPELQSFKYSMFRIRKTYKLNPENITQEEHLLSQ